MICTGECKCADYQVGKTSPPEILTAGFSGSESRRGYTGGRVPLPTLPTSGAHCPALYEGEEYCTLLRGVTLPDVTFFLYILL